MRFLFAVFCFFLTLSQTYGSGILTSTQSILSPIVNGLVGATGGSWRQYIIGITSLQTTVKDAVLYAQVIGTVGAATWVKLEHDLSSTYITRFIANVSDVGDLVELDLMSTLNNGLKILYIELDNRGSLLLSNGISLSDNATSGSGYAYLNIQVAIDSTVASLVSGISNDVTFLNNVISQALSILNVGSFLFSILGLGGLLGGLGL